jgi:hypothetical protein
VRDSDGRWIVEVPSPDNAPKRHVQNVLSAVERWLWIYGVDGVNVQLDGEVHTLSRAATRRSG